MKTGTVGVLVAIVLLALAAFGWNPTVATAEPLTEVSISDSPQAVPVAVSDEPAVRSLVDDRGQVSSISYDLVEGETVEWDLTDAVALEKSPASSAAWLDAAGFELERAEKTPLGDRYTMYLTDVTTAADYAKVLTALNRKSETAALPVLVDPTSGRRAVLRPQVAVAVEEGSRGKLEELVAAIGGHIVREMLLPDTYVVRLDVHTGMEALTKLVSFQEAPFVRWAEPDLFQQYELGAVLNDTLFANQWHLNNTGQQTPGAQFPGIAGVDVNGVEAFDLTLGDSSTIIAVVDDGVDCAHPDLSCVGGYDAVDDDFDPSPAGSDDNHGTAVAGVSAAQGNNGIGVSGACPQCRVMPIKIFGPSGYAGNTETADGIAWAVDNGADVINNSWGSTGASSTIHSAIQYAVTNGRGGLGSAVLSATGNSRIDNNVGFDSFRISGLYPGTWTVELNFVKTGSTPTHNDTVYVDSVMLVNGDNTIASEYGFTDDALPADWTQCAGSDASWTGSGDPYVYYGGIDVGSLSPEAIATGETACAQFDSTVTVTGGYFYLRFLQSCEEDLDYVEIYLTYEGGTRQGPWQLYSWQNAAPSVDVAYPARFVESMAVGSCTDTNVRSVYSQFGPEVDFVAPSNGGWAGITTTDRVGADGYNDGTASDNYADPDYSNSFGGTSSATPLASGVAGLLLSYDPSLTAVEVQQRLRETADPIGDLPYAKGTGSNDQYGYGRINVEAALDFCDGCDIGGTCYADQDINPANDCELCDVATSTTGWTPATTGTSCDDGLYCTTGDQCDGAGTCGGDARNCDDGLFCTGVETCDDQADMCVSAGDPCTAPDVCNETADLCDTSTGIELVAFDAEAVADRVNLTWETAAEPGNAGFALWRSGSAGGKYERITISLIPAEGDGFTGASYEWTDDALADGTYFYKLEDVDLTGRSTFHGPVDVTVDANSIGCGVGNTDGGFGLTIVLLAIGAAIVASRRNEKAHRKPTVATK